MYSYIIRKTYAELDVRNQQAFFDLYNQEKLEGAIDTEAKIGSALTNHVLTLSLRNK